VSLGEERNTDAAALLYFALGAHRLALRLDEVVRVRARTRLDHKLPASPLLGLLGIDSAAITHLIELDGGGTAPATAPPRAATRGLRAWPMPPGASRLRVALAGVAECEELGTAFVVSAEGLRWLATREGDDITPSTLDGFDELE